MSNKPPDPTDRPDADADELETQRGRRVWSSTPPPAPPVPGRRTPPPPEPGETPAYVRPWLPDPAEAPARPSPAARAGERREAPPPTARAAAPAEAGPTRTLGYEGSGPRAAPAAGRGCLILGGMAMVTVLACALLGYGALQSGLSRLTGFPSFSLPAATPTIIPQPPIILRIQALSRLETQSYDMDTLVTGEVPGILPEPFTGDKILFLGHGEAVAGVDLGKMGDEDIIVYTDTGQVELRVPAAELFYVRLDNEKSRVYDRQTGLFSRASPELETQVRQEAERQIRQSAIEGGILPQAQSNAEKTLRTLLASLGYTNVRIIVKPATAPVPGTPTP